MATTVNDCVEMVKACKTDGVKLGVGFQLRYHPGHVEAAGWCGKADWVWWPVLRYYWARARGDKSIVTLGQV